MSIIALNAEFEKDIGPPNDLVHFSPLKRKTNQKDSRQNEAPALKARGCPRRFAMPPHPNVTGQ